MQSKQEAIKSFLIDELKAGPKPREEIFTRAAAQGFAQRTMYEALRTLGIVTSKQMKEGKYIIKLMLPIALKPIS